MDDTVKLRQKTRNFRRLLQSCILIPGEITEVANDSGVPSIKVDDSDTVNLVWVKLYGNDERIVQAYNVKVTPHDGMPVLLRKTMNGEFVIAEGDAVAGTDLYGEGAPTVFAPELIGELMGTVWPARNLKPGRARLSELGGMYLHIESFFHSAGYFSENDIDLTAYIPATTDKHAYVKVWYDPNSDTLGATAGTEHDLIYTLTEFDLGAISIPASYIPLAGVILTEGDTALSGSTTILAAQNWIDAPVTGEAYFPIVVTDTRTIPTNRQLVISRVEIGTGGSITIDGLIQFVG